jgi:hypothetical protein
MKLSEEKEDGTLKPVDAPPELTKKVYIYSKLKAIDFSLEEIKWLAEDRPSNLIVEVK